MPSGPGRGEAAESVRYLGRAEVESIELTPAAVLEALQQAFRDHAAQATVHRPPLHLDFGPGHGFRAFCSAWPARGVASSKWLGIGPAAPGDPGTGIDSVIAISDIPTGRLLCVMDGARVTRIRTAGMSTLAARRLADPDAGSVGFVGCGAQAHSHLESLVSAFPGLRSVHAFSRTRESAQRLLGQARAAGLEGRLCETAEQAISDAAIVVTSVPAAPGLEPFLDADRVAPGAFVAAVDVGRSWRPERLDRFDLLVCEDRAQWSSAPFPSASTGKHATFDADLADLVSGRHPGRSGSGCRSMFLFQGHGLADLAVACALYGAACAHGIGMRLPR
jgi:alanine dehydrogenase